MDAFLEISRALILKELRTDAGKIDAFGLFVLVGYIIYASASGAPILKIEDRSVDGYLLLLLVLAIYPIVSIKSLPPPGPPAN